MTLHAVKSEGLVSIDDAALWLSVSRRTVTRLLASGQLPYVRVANLRRINVTALHAYVAAQEARITPTRRLRTIPSSNVR